MGCVAECIGMEEESDETKTMLLPSDGRVGAVQEDEYITMDMFASVDSKSYSFVYWYCVDAASRSFPHEIARTIYSYYNTELQDMAILIQRVDTFSDDEQELVFNYVARSDWQPQSKQSHTVFAVNQTKCKILLLGAANVGKSTIFRQLRYLYGYPSNQMELWSSKPIITQNLIQSMKTLAKHSKVDESNEEMRQNVSNMEDQQRYTGSQHELFVALLADDGVQNTIKQRAKLPLALPDSYQYLFRNMHQYCREQYVPTAVDLIHSYQRTTGANNTHFVHSQGNLRSYEIVDVGGLKYERRKWIHFYDGTNVVMNVIDLSGFCTQVLFILAFSLFSEHVCFSEADCVNTQQRGGGNRLKENIGVFKSIVNLEVFQQCEWMVILNKYDVLEEYVDAGMKFNEYFPEYRADNRNSLQLIEFVVMQLLREIRDEGRKSKITFFVTTALNAGSIQSVFEYLHCNLLENAQ